MNARLIRNVTLFVIAAAAPPLFMMWRTGAILNVMPPAHLELASEMQTTDAPVYSESGFDITPLSDDQIDELAKELTAEEVKIILRKGTEAPFCGTLLDNKKKGMYVCRLCSLPLFASDAKFTSGSGWPSFFRPIDAAHVRTYRDTSHGMVREEIVCARCDGHLGHVFEDGPKPTGLRFCLNSASLTFFEEGEDVPEASQPIATETAYFAGGCFWGVEDRFQKLPGVISSVSGYQGGQVEDPTYRQVCYTDTGHAESVRVTFDPARISYRDLLAAFFRFHDPTQLNRQGPDVGTQYRSAIFCVDEDQLNAAREFIAEQAERSRFDGKKIVTQVEMAPTFYPAEDYHQDYYKKNGGSCPIPMYE